MRGRRAEKKRHRVATGNRGNKKPRRWVAAQASEFPDPKFSSKLAGQCYAAMKAEMKLVKTLTSTHRILLWQAAEQWADVICYRERIKKDGRYETYYDKEGNGLQRKSAAVLALEQADPRLQKSLELLGLTPVTMNKVQPIDEPEKEPGAEFFE